jgi:hypothetical protein
MVDKNYRMSKPLKTMLYTMEDTNLRATYKKLFMEAENHYSTNRKKMSIKILDTETED